MKKTIYLIMAAAVALMAAACSKDYSYDSGYYDDRYYETSKEVLTLRNFSSDTTVWFIPELECAENLPSELSEWQKIAVTQLLPHSSGTLTFDSNDSYVTPIETYGPDDNLSIYVFKKNVWDNYLWSDIVKDRMWCGHCTLSVEEAIALRGIVTYPMR